MGTCTAIIDLRAPIGREKVRGFQPPWYTVYRYRCSECNGEHRIRAGAFRGTTPEPGTGGIRCGRPLPTPDPIPAGAEPVATLRREGKTGGRWPKYTLYRGDEDLGFIRRVSASVGANYSGSRADAWEAGGRQLMTQNAAEAWLVERADRKSGGA